jgi:hypothetical protein
MTSNNRRVSLAALLLALAVMPRAEATLMKAATFDEKVSNSSAIVLGHVIRTESKWDADHHWILTYTTFKIEKSMKGLPGQSEVTVVTPGGQVGDVHQDTVGVPEFAKDSDNVLFIRNTEVGPTVLFFDQGAYDVEKSGSQRIVKPVASDAVHIDTQRGIAVGPESALALDQFERSVHDSEKRVIFNRMAMIKRQQRAFEDHAVGAMVGDFKWVILVALAGIALASWQLLRR